MFGITKIINLDKRGDNHKLKAHHLRVNNDYQSIINFLLLINSLLILTFIININYFNY